MVDIRAFPCVLDLLIERHTLVILPAAATEDSFSARAHIHANVSTSTARSLHLELPANFCTVTHREVVDHIAGVCIVPLFDHFLLRAIENRLLAQVAPDHEYITLLSQCQNRLPDVNLSHFCVQHDFFDDSS